jgi:drug/metabolite transporter (DMT)-like permease
MSGVVRSPVRPLRFPALPRAEGPLRGILLILTAMALFSCTDATSKFLSGRLPPIEIGWIRYLVFVLMALPPVRRAGVRSGRKRLQILRGLGLVGSSIAFIYAVQNLPLADATSMGFVSPIFTLVLAVLLLGERVGPQRWIAVGAGLIGVLIVVRPGAGAFRLEAAFPVISAACWAGAMVATRRMVTTERPGTTLFWTAATGLIVLTLLLPIGFVWPTPFDLGLAVLIGVVASAGQWLVVLAYRHAPASLLAPFSYSQLIWSTTLGFLVFGAVPDGWTLVGALVIVASGLIVARAPREDGGNGFGAKPQAS